MSVTRTIVMTVLTMAAVATHSRAEKLRKKRDYGRSYDSDSRHTNWKKRSGVDQRIFVQIGENARMSFAGFFMKPEGSNRSKK
jgi:hypothetical protein